MQGRCVWGVVDQRISNERQWPFFFFSWVGQRDEGMSLLGARTSMKCFLLLCESTL